MREVIFYRTANGRSPVEDFLDSLTAKQARKVTWVLQLLETLGRVPGQYFKKLEGSDGIWEVRVDSGKDTFRLLGFMDKGSLVILTNGFAKKSQNTPVSEIELAQQRKKDYLKRNTKR
jgi:phage-related protein